MEEHESQADSAPRRPPSGRRTAKERSRAQELLSAQRSRLEHIEEDLTSQVDDLLRTAAEGMTADAQSIRQEFDRRDQSLAEQIRQHQSSVEQFRQQQDVLARKYDELESARMELAEERQALKRSQAESQFESEQIGRSRGRCQQLEERLAREAEQLEVRREQTKNQRRRIAQDLKAERASQQHEVDELRRTIEHMRITQQRGIEQATAELKRQREELEQRRQQHQQEADRQRDALEKRTAAIDAESAKLESNAAQLEDKAADLEAARQQLDRRERQLSDQTSAESKQRAEQIQQLSSALSEARETAATSTAAASELQQTVDELRQSHERLRESTEVSEQRHGELQHKHEVLQQEYQEFRRNQRDSVDSQAQSASEWEAERAALIARAAEAEHMLAQIDPRQMEDSQRRFELAISDVRDLKRRNAELEEQLIGLRAAGVGSIPQRTDDLITPDWEATKRRMLETLEADDGSSEDPISVEERLTVASTIQITDEIVAHKDREMAELRMFLSQQSSNIGAVAVGAAAIAENFDRDELIQQEREKLRVLQEEWRDKLRQAEIDISIERARIARQRAEVDEKVSAYDSARAQHNPDDSAATPGSQPKQPTRGRWLARLGLKDDAG